MNTQKNPLKFHQNRSKSFTQNNSKNDIQQLNLFIKEQLNELKRKRKLPSLIQQESDYLMDEINKITNIYKIPHIKTHSAIPKLITFQNQQKISHHNFKPSTLLTERKHFQVKTLIRSSQPTIKINNNIFIENQDSIHV
ncbi:unnamed protein product [Paramecium sonneborni]|uniref:Uncharacterized protein n=1 Tax=Paramecium sonneborni TaxID=65129 RepID=A0A8S1NGT9_9CILI|nr:unnamed protein product [Paramecium sonneborni]